MYVKRLECYGYLLLHPNKPPTPIIHFILTTFKTEQNTWKCVRVDEDGALEKSTDIVRVDEDGALEKSTDVSSLLVDDFNISM